MNRFEDRQWMAANDPPNRELMVTRQVRSSYGPAALLNATSSRVFGTGLLLAKRICPALNDL